MSKPRCLCCKNWDHAYRNAVCDACRNGDKWEAKGECKGADGVLCCDSCKHSANKEPHRQEPAAGSQYGGGVGSARNQPSGEQP